MNIQIKENTICSFSIDKVKDFFFHHTIEIESDIVVGEFNYQTINETKNKSGFYNVYSLNNCLVLSKDIILEEDISKMVWSSISNKNDLIVVKENFCGFWDKNKIDKINTALSLNTERNTIPPMHLDFIIEFNEELGLSAVKIKNLKDRQKCVEAGLDLELTIGVVTSISLDREELELLGLYATESGLFLLLNKSYENYLAEKYVTEIYNDIINSRYKKYKLINNKETSSLVEQNRIETTSQCCIS